MVQDCISGMGSDGGNSGLLMNNSEILSFLQQQAQNTDGGFNLNLDGQRSSVGSSQFPSSFLNNRGPPTNNMLLNSGLSLQQLASDFEVKRSTSSQNMTECVPVPSSEHVAEIVGRQGCKIKALRAKTNTYIKTPVRGDEPIFVVTGRREDVANAKREILSAADHFSQIRACRRSNLNGSMAPGPPANLPGHVTEYVEVPYKVVGLVVGPKGATIKKIQQSTNTYIVTPSRDREPKFEISGLPENVSKAKKLIQEHIAERTGFSDNMPVSFEALNRIASANNLGTGNLGQNLMGDQTQSLNTMLSNNCPTLGAIARSQFNSPNSYLNSLNSIPSSFSANDFAMAGFPGFGTTENSLTPSVPLNNLGGLSTSSLASNSASIANNILAQPFGSSSLADTVSSFSGLGSRSTRQSEEWEAFRNPSFGGNYSSLGRIGSRSSDEGIGSSSNSSPALNDAVMNPWNSVLSSNPLGSNRQSPDLRSEFDPMREVNHSLANLRLPQSAGEVFTATKDILQQSKNALLANAAAAAATTSTPSEESLFSFSAGASDTTSLSPLSRQSPTNSKVKRCHYCTSTKVNAFFVPCGHNVTCGECAFKLENESRQCPLCHQTVTQVVGHLGEESTR